MKRRLLIVLLVTALMLTLPASAAGPLFPDVAPEHWAYSDIQKAADYGLMNGLADGTFGSETRLDRAAFLTVLCRMFSWTQPDLTHPFPDVAPGSWYEGAVANAYAHGILEGDSFRPTDYITRQEMAVLLVRALGYDTLAQDLNAQPSPFPDVTQNVGSITVAQAVGMTEGVAVNGQLLFQPSSFATRGQAAAMLVRVYERYISQTQWLHGFYAFSSYSQLHYTAQMDGVSVGWARMSWSPETGPWVNSTPAEGNEWFVPNGSDEATGYFQQHQVPYNLNVFADTGKRLSLPDGTMTSVVHQVTATAQGRDAAVAALVAASQNYGGLTIDFEGLKGDQVKADFVTFMTQLRAALPGDKTLFVCVQPDQWYTGFDYRGLGQVCDRVILMAHDYQWTGVEQSYLGRVMGQAGTSSPVTPFPDIFQALRDITDPVIGVQDRSKIALAISFGSAGFRVDGQDRLLDTEIRHPAQETIARRMAQPDSAIRYDAHSRNPVMTYTTEEGERYMLWYENEQSVADKLALARMFGITGVSVWRLGNIPSYPQYDVWSVLAPTS